MAKNKIILMILMLIAITTLVACNSSKSNIENLQNICTNNSGTWIEEYNECSYISEEICNQMNGSFNECASSCRHQTGEQLMCTMQCVPLCTFNLES